MQNEYVELQHHGIKGQKWGIRRFQNKDGSLTVSGKVHYKVATAKLKSVSDKAEKARGTFEKSKPSTFKRAVAYNRMFNADQKLKEVLQWNKNVKISDLKASDNSQVKAYVDQLLRARNLNKAGFKNY